MLFKLSNVNSNLALTLGYFNSALNNSAQDFRCVLRCEKSGVKTMHFYQIKMKNNSQLRNLEG